MLLSWMILWLYKVLFQVGFGTACFRTAGIGLLIESIDRTSSVFVAAGKSLLC